MRICYKINTPHVVYEIIEGETIIINMKNGIYYNLNGSGTTLWEILEKKPDIKSITEAYATTFNMDEANLFNDINYFLSLLLMENLIAPEYSEENVNKEEIIKIIKNRLPEFSQPTIKKYSDMKEVLLLDPIHEIDEEMGWPNINEELYYREQEEKKDKQ